MSYQLPPKKNIASFDVDPQKGFTELCPDELPAIGGQDIGDELNKQATFAQLRVGSKEAHHPEAIWVASETQPTGTHLPHPHAKIAWPEHAIHGTKGAELLDELPAIIDYDYFVWKGIEFDLHPYGGCYHDLNNKLSTGVIEFLKCRDITTVIVGGLVLDYCVHVTAVQLKEAGFDVIVNLAATRAVDPKTGKETIEELTQLGIHFVDSCDDFLTDDA